MSPGKLASTELAVGHARRTLRLAQPQTPAFYPDKGRREAAIPTGPGRTLAHQAARFQDARLPGQHFGSAGPPSRANTRPVKDVNLKRP